MCVSKPAFKGGCQKGRASEMNFKPRLWTPPHQGVSRGVSSGWGGVHHLFCTMSAACLLFVTFTPLFLNDRLYRNRCCLDKPSWLTLILISLSFFEPLSFQTYKKNEHKHSLKQTRVKYSSKFGAPVLFGANPWRMGHVTVVVWTVRCGYKGVGGRVVGFAVMNYVVPKLKHICESNSTMSSNNQCRCVV